MEKTESNDPAPIVGACRYRRNLIYEDCTVTTEAACRANYGLMVISWTPGTNCDGYAFDESAVKEGSCKIKDEREAE